MHFHAVCRAGLLVPGVFVNLSTGIINIGIECSAYQSFKEMGSPWVLFSLFQVQAVQPVQGVQQGSEPVRCAADGHISAAGSPEHPAL